LLSLGASICWSFLGDWKEISAKSLVVRLIFELFLEIQSFY
jgi:hypothetical protein